MEQIEPFVDFLARIASARPEQYSDAIRAAAEHHGLSPERVTDEFQRMKSYILSYYEGVRPVCSFLNTAGNPVDCVPFDQQPTVQAARAAGYPTEVRPPQPAVIPGLPSSVNVGPPAVPVSGISQPPGHSTPPVSPSPPSGPQPYQIPQGTVPLPRITLNRLIQFGTLGNVFHKNVAPPTSA